jgi:long-subunit fatty acid transport protein
MQTYKNQGNRGILVRKNLLFPSFKPKIYPMRKFLTIVSATFITGSLFAGGLVTNTNQSASWVRLPARDASTEIDAVYFNPAGLMKLDNGFHFSISNQIISQNKEVENFYKGPGDAYGLNESLFIGKVSAPIFPSVYAAYKLDKFAFSLGFNPVGGGGGAKYDKGLPSFEMTPSDLVPALGSQGVTAYRLDAFLEGSSVYFGFQGGVSYKINDFISIGAGVRYVNAKNTYLGHLQDIEVETPGGWVRADDVLNGISGVATTAATSTTALVTAGAGSLTLAQAEQATIITTQQRMALEAGLTAFGYPPTVTIAQADAVFKGAASQYSATADLLGDQEVDVEQTGTGYTPFFSINISPADNLNIAVKYEMATKLELENKTSKDFTVGYTPEGDPVTMFPDGEKIRNDMPAMLSVGVDYGATSKLNVSAGVHYYFDKTANYGHKLNGVYVDNDQIIDNNFYELAGGLQYKLNDFILLSGGYLYAKTGVNDDYQSDLTYSLTSSTVGAGGAINILENLRLNLGFALTFYDDGEKTIQHLFSPTQTNIPARETYYKDAMIIGVGVDFSF